MASWYSQIEPKLLTYTCWIYYIQLPGSPVSHTGFPFLFSLPVSLSRYFSHLVLSTHNIRPVSSFLKFLSAF